MKRRQKIAALLAMTALLAGCGYEIVEKPTPPPPPPPRFVFQRQTSDSRAFDVYTITDRETGSRWIAVYGTANIPAPTLAPLKEAKP